MKNNTLPLDDRSNKTFIAFDEDRKLGYKTADNEYWIQVYGRLIDYWQRWVDTQSSGVMSRSVYCSGSLSVKMGNNYEMAGRLFATG